MVTKSMATEIMEMDEVLHRRYRSGAGAAGPAAATSDLEFWGRIWERRNRGARSAARSGDGWENEYDANLDRAVEGWEDEDSEDLKVVR